MTAEAARVSSAIVVAALQKASAATGSDFNYLLGTAIRESSLKPQAQSSTSSAAGLFQFVEQTWYGLVKQYGAKYGLGSYAKAISQGADGHFHANNAQDRQAILSLRTDPQISALMAGEYARETKTAMQGVLGREVCGGELYAAHFLGPDAACRLIHLNGSEPSASAANAFPQAAGANKSVFYHANGTAKSVREVYDWALRQPVMSSEPKAPAAPPANYVAGAPATGYEDLIASMWRPTSSSGFFPSGMGDTGLTPSLLSPSVLDILSSLSPVAPKRGNS